MGGVTKSHAPAAEAFSAFTAWLHAILPFRLRQIIPQTFIGFALINSCTFLFDMLLLWLSFSVLGVPYPVAVSVSFGIAASVAFFLNKFLNFRARGDIGKQSGKYVLVLVTNYLIWILGFSTLLEWIGVHYMVARITAALCEGLYIYLCSKLWVFRHRRADRFDPGPATA
ncbi:MAG: GtrA family protein [Propionibacterium sp.]|nr:GtrA family protein [Propionibacterium sp.]